MPNTLKRFEERATDSLSGEFRLARLKLTILYAILLAIILAISSFVIYSTFSKRFQQHVEYGLHYYNLSVKQDFNLPNQARTDLVDTLLLVNSLLFAGSVVFSYWLAGETLLPIQASFERQRRFLSDASHELRTPLTILQTDLENQLHSQSLSLENREQLDSQLEEVVRMGSLVKDLLLLSRLDSLEGRAHHVEPIDLNKIAANAVERLKAYAQKHEITLSFTPCPSSSLVQAQSEQLLQAVSNLIKNAIDYNKTGGKVQVEVKRDAHKILLLVEDTGVGIAEDKVDKLFDRFYRLEDSRSRQAGGSGLGLAIVKSIVETYAGSASIKSSLGQGTTVTLSFPLLTS